VECTVFDPNMNDAWELAEKMGPPPEIPPTLDNKERRTRFALELDSTFAGILIRNLSENQKSLWLQKVDEVASKFTSEQSSDKRINCSLRLWAGVLTGAKIVALETRAGPVTPENRRKASTEMQERSRRDPIFRAGLEVATRFKELRGQAYSLEGVLPGSPIFGR